MTEENTINLLKNVGLFEVSQITSFECYRKAKDGTTQKVIVEILDAGIDVNPELRYQCEARTKDGKIATGNPASSIDDVISTVHWHELDR
jgi:hypothetical protein